MGLPEVSTILWRERHLLELLVFKLDAQQLLRAIPDQLVWLDADGRVLAEPMVAGMWGAQLASAPPSFLRYLRYLSVADGEKAARVMGFRPAYTTREALLDYISAQRLRDVRLLQETPA